MCMTLLVKVMLTIAEKSNCMSLNLRIELPISKGHAHVFPCSISNLIVNLKDWSWSHVHDLAGESHANNRREK